MSTSQIRERPVVVCGKAGLPGIYAQPQTDISKPRENGTASASAPAGTSSHHRHQDSTSSKGPELASISVEQHVRNLALLNHTPTPDSPTTIASPTPTPGPPPHHQLTSPVPFEQSQTPPGGGAAMQYPHYATPPLNPHPGSQPGPPHSIHFNVHGIPFHSFGDHLPPGPGHYAFHPLAPPPPHLLPQAHYHHHGFPPQGQHQPLHLYTTHNHPPPHPSQQQPLDFFQGGHERQLSDSTANVNVGFHYHPPHHAHPPPPPPHHPTLSPPITPYGPPPPGAFPLSPNTPAPPPLSFPPLPLPALIPTQTGTQATSTVPNNPASSTISSESAAPSPAMAPVSFAESRPEPYLNGESRRYRSGSKSSATSYKAPPSMNADNFPPLGTQRPKQSWNTPAQSPQQPTFQNNRESWHQEDGYTPRTSHGRPNSYHQHQHGQTHHPRHRHGSPDIHRQIQELNKVAAHYIKEAAPSEEELERRRQFHERLQKVCEKVSPEGELRLFGSVASGFACSGSDVDLIYVNRDGSTVDSSKIAHLLHEAFKAEGYNLLLISKTRVPILKLSETFKVLPETVGTPLHADIGFGSELAFVNTKLLATYSRCDPRLWQMVMFVKWWSKKREINIPYRGTLSSYGFVLMIIHYLMNIAQPPVLPNLQSWPIPPGTPQHLLRSSTGENIWFWQDWDEIDRVAAQGGINVNTQSVGELLRGFFAYYADGRSGWGFDWIRGVISIRTKGGILTKDEKGWKTAVQRTKEQPTANGATSTSYKDRYLFAIEDPFETSHNISRTCSMAGVNRIRDEFRRANRLVRLVNGERGLWEGLFAEPGTEADEIGRYVPPAHGGQGGGGGYQGRRGGRQVNGGRGGGYQNGTGHGLGHVPSSQPVMSIMDLANLHLNTQTTTSTPTTAVNGNSNFSTSDAPQPAPPTTSTAEFPPLPNGKTSSASTTATVTASSTVSKTAGSIRPPPAVPLRSRPTPAK